eukprot:213133-Pleurochrysis_carterae.AAC.1
MVAYTLQQHVSELQTAAFSLYVYLSNNLAVLTVECCISVAQAARAKRCSSSSSERRSTGACCAKHNAS